MKKVFLKKVGVAVIAADLFFSCSDKWQGVRVIMKCFSKLLFVLFFFSIPLSAQNSASIEVPLGISFVYSIDYHPLWHTQIKPTVGFGLGRDYIAGKWYTLIYEFSVEQRFYYNLLKRELKGKKTFHKSANFISIKPTFDYQHYLKNDMLAEVKVSVFSCPVNLGLRRSINSRFYFDGSIGLGPAYNTYDKRFYPRGNINIAIGFKLF